MMCGAGVSGGFRRSRGGRLLPRCRAVDRAAVRPDGNHFRQLALRRKVAGNVPAMCGMEAEVCRALSRIEHDCASLEFVAHEVERRNEIRIAGDYDKSIGGVCVGIAEKRGREIYVRPLLFNLYHMDKAVCRCRTFLTSGINGWNYRFHSFPIKKIGPQTLRPKTLFRVGRTLRLDMNLLTGSTHIVPNRGGGNKGGKFQKIKSCEATKR